MAVRLFAPLKINLTLAVVGRRADGYHLLSSLVVFGDYGDFITIEPAVDSSPEGNIIVKGDFKDNIGAVDNNTVKKSIELCETATNKKFLDRITIEKNIPIGGGLGGGTSDGIAMIKYLSQQWGIDSMTTKKLTLAIGADGPALLHAQPCLMTGIGEAITPAALPAEFLSCHILLVWDGTYISTGEVFATIDKLESNLPSATKKLENNQSSANQSPATIDSIDIDDIKNWHNDLEMATFTLHPHLQKIKKTIADNQGCQLVNMTGSGGCFYALFDSDTHIQSAIKNLKEKKLWVQQIGLHDNLALSHGAGYRD